MSVNQPQSDEIYDVVILGAGAAGITIARQLGKSGIKTALVEAGGYDATEESQALYSGTTTGLNYDLRGSRLRMFGGTTNHWGGWCRPLDEQAFTPNPTIDYPGWSINRDDIDPYLSEALQIVDIDPSAPWEPPENIQHSHFNQTLLQAGFKEVYWQWSPPTRFKNKYRQELERDRNITTFINESLIDFDYTPEGKINGAVIYNPETDTRQIIFGKLFVMACGGIENARLLLHINDKNDVNFGNQSGVLGKYFMEHPHSLQVGRIIFLNSDYEHIATPDSSETRFFAPLPTLTSREEIVPVVVRIVQNKPNETSDREWFNVLRTITTLYGQDKWRRYNIDISTEQVPTSTNAITLSDEKDKLGINKPILHWRLAPIDRKSIRKTLLTFATSILNVNGRCHLNPLGI